MLVLTRKVGEKIFIGGNITVTVLRIGKRTVRLAFEAPGTMKIVRWELLPAAGQGAEPQDPQ